MIARGGLGQAARSWRWSGAWPGAWPGAWLARIGEPPTGAPRDGRSDAISEPIQQAMTGGAPLDAAYEAFIREHQRAILNYLWRMTGDEQSAYDLAQEVFVRAWRRFEKLRDYERPRGWLFRVATNLALTSLTGRRAPLASVDLLSADQEPMVSDPAGRVAERDAVRTALAGLSPRRRAALILREVYGLSCAEVARTLGVSDAAARMTLSRAREQFRALYLAEGGDEHGE